MNRCIVFLQFLNKGSTVIWCYLFSSALFVSLNWPFISVLSVFCLLGLHFSTLIRIIAYLDNLSPNSIKLARVYCTSK
jgi:hypothetical protein